MIEVERLTRTFGLFCAVDHISFQVPKGQILGFLGPNGAGKSTTMKMLTGFLQPTSGTARVGGLDVATSPRAAKRLFGYLPESAPSYSEMTVHEFLRFMASMRELGAQTEPALDRVRTSCHLRDVWHQPIETLSKGFRQRVGFAQAILHDPPYLIMDEPTDGLDPNQKEEVRQLIRTMGSEKTIILSTHILEEVEALCQRILIISKGKIIKDSAPSELRHLAEDFQAVTIEFATPPGETELQFWQKNPAVRAADFDATLLQLTLFPTTNVRLLPTLLPQAAQQKNVKNIFEHRGRIDSVFRRLTLGDHHDTNI